MAYRPKIKTNANGDLQDLPIDAETLQGQTPSEISSHIYDKIKSELIDAKADKTDLTSHIENKSNPHSVTKAQVGLGNVGNFKAVSTVANQGLTDAEKSNARANIGAGTSSFSGSYNDLSNKPTIPTVNNATLTIQKNGSKIATFTANSNTNTTANIIVPDPVNYYWANVKVSSTSSTTTNPTFGNVTATGNILSSAHDTGRLGDENRYWNLVYANTIEAWSIYYYDIYNKSDKRLKTNIKESSLNALSIINNTKIHEYKYKHFEKINNKKNIERKKAQEKLSSIPKIKENKEIRKKLSKIIHAPNNSSAFELGIIAQELESILPKEYKKVFISKEDTKENSGELGIKASSLLHLLWKGIQEQQELINNLSSRVKELEERLGNVYGTRNNENNN